MTSLQDEIYDIYGTNQISGCFFLDVTSFCVTLESTETPKWHNIFQNGQLL